MGKMMKIITLVSIPLTIAVSTLLMNHYQVVYRTTFNYTPFQTTFIITSILIGASLGLEYLSSTNPINSKPHVDWLKLGRYCSRLCFSVKPQK